MQSLVRDTMEIFVPTSIFSPFKQHRRQMLNSQQSCKMMEKVSSMTTIMTVPSRKCAIQESITRHISAVLQYGRTGLLADLWRPWRTGECDLLLSRYLSLCPSRPFLKLLCFQSISRATLRFPLPFRSRDRSRL